MFRDYFHKTAQARHMKWFYVLLEKHVLNRLVQLTFIYLMQILLGTSEYLMEVSGTTGPFGDVSEVITSLMLVSNVRCYGPFGEPRGTQFYSRAKKNSSIVRFFGRSGNHLDAIGVYFHPI